MNPPIPFAWLSLTLIMITMIGGGCSRTTMGVAMTKDTTAFVRRGITDRAEVLSTLGPAFYELEKQRSIAYVWETTKTGRGYSILGEFYDTTPPPTRWLFCVQFDANDVVVRHGITQELEGESTRRAIIRWFEQENAVVKNQAGN